MIVRFAFGMLVLIRAMSPQTLSIGTAPASAGEKTAVAIFFEATGDTRPVAMQWEIDYPANVLQLDAQDITASNAAKKAGKSVTCAGKWKKPGTTYSFRCVLAGGREPIESGPVAVLNATVAPGARRAKTRLRLSSVIVVDADLRRSNPQNSEGMLTIR